MDTNKQANQNFKEWAKITGCGVVAVGIGGAFFELGSFINGFRQNSIELQTMQTALAIGSQITGVSALICGSITTVGGTIGTVATGVYAGLKRLQR